MTSSNTGLLDGGLVVKALDDALSGAGAHAQTARVFDALDWQLAGVRPGNAPHSACQLLHHMVFWQDWVVRWLDGESPAVPEHASGSWTGAAAPETASAWDEAVERYQRGLDVLRRCAHDEARLAQGGARSRLEVLHTIAAHNSYHAGQVVLLRQMLGAWPPPSGGLTW